MYDENQEVTVVLTSYNKPSFLKKAIQSVLYQTYDRVHLIIADDNSSDPYVSKVIIDSMKYNGNKRITSFNSNVEEKDRLLTARYATQINTAIRHFSNSKYICYLADDDFYYPSMIEKMVSFAEHNKREVVFCAQHILDENGNIDGNGENGRGIRFFNEVLSRGADKLDHNQVMNTRRVFDEVGGWDDSPGTWSGADAYFFDRIEKLEVSKFYPIDYSEPLQAKVYREKSVQWNMTNGLSPDGSSLKGG